MCFIVGACQEVNTRVLQSIIRAKLIEAEKEPLALRLGEVETALLSADRAVVGGDPDRANTQHPRAEQ